MEEAIREFLREDIGHGDITTEGIFRGERVKAVLIAKEGGCLAGMPFATKVFELLGGVEVFSTKKDGETFEAGERLLILEGSAESILKGERLALNILQSLSGIATLTRTVVEKLKGTGIELLDTRKTTPGFRYFEKYAVRVGGGKNHRFALYDMVLIKDNHKKVVGGIKEAVKRIKQVLGPAYKIEVEVESIEELYEALECEVDMVMLDNFTPDDVKRAVEIIKGKVKVEVSGNITPENIKEYAIEGVNYISCGFITHSARWLDMSMKIL
ncbi:MAG: carboxylating nicotinate-nucleotide diphosphorylase [Hydrogenobacter thermophilus]|uniref:carboxylating nicotinate-nucleotide diphosphorylase n=1 Tax=Hydrogenobacter thermophilus TaxID=940 RepID=UPI001C73F73A|nr:carboxylating nicotinate-nucleotide diphosphorylase [Hydrogenobacter thermophilus]QWK19987.1 MAG: carboxylating nicotinate-nucleotide diphosphorylase [Hydrogenobacter thermophilus]